MRLPRPVSKSSAPRTDVRWSRTLSLFVPLRTRGPRDIGEIADDTTGGTKTSGTTVPMDRPTECPVGGVDRGPRGRLSRYLADNLHLMSYSQPVRAVQVAPVGYASAFVARAAQCSAIKTSLYGTHGLLLTHAERVACRGCYEVVSTRRWLRLAPSGELVCWRVQRRSLMSKHGVPVVATKPERTGWLPEVGRRLLDRRIVHVHSVALHDRAITWLATTATCRSNPTRARAHWLGDRRVALQSSRPHDRHRSRRRDDLRDRGWRPLQPSSIRRRRAPVMLTRVRYPSVGSRSLTGSYPNITR